MVCFVLLFVLTGAEEAGSGWGGGPARVRGPCGVPEGPESGSYAPEEASPVGKKNT